MQTAVVIVAAGRGTRVSSGDAPKQYRALAGKPVLRRTQEIFLRHEAIDAIITVIHPEDAGLYERRAGAPGSKLMQPVFGGATRQGSVFAGLEALVDKKPAKVLVHDAARPFADAPLIDRVLKGLDDHEGAVPALAVTDTLKRAASGVIEETVDRTNLWGVQTPQGFHFEKLHEAHRAARSKGLDDFTDDSAVAEWHGLDVALVEGASENIKLTTDEDFERAEALLKRKDDSSQGEFRVGQGYDVHAFTDGDHVMLCGVRVPHDQALAGHSDADVGLHALTDALLGAIGDGDIGQHFPPSDPKWKGAASDRFLRDAGARVREKGGRVVNVDVTLICEEPKIGPHRETMCQRIAEILNIEQTRVSVKATTSEGLGFTGRGEGIAAQATAMIVLG